MCGVVRVNGALPAEDGDEDGVEVVGISFCVTEGAVGGGDDVGGVPEREDWDCPGMEEEVVRDKGEVCWGWDEGFIPF